MTKDDALKIAHAIDVSDSDDTSIMSAVDLVTLIYQQSIALDIIYAKRIYDSIIGDKERDHITVDQLLQELLLDIDLTYTQRAYNDASENFWYA